MTPRMRVCKKCMEELRKEDPETAVTEYYIRQLVRNKKIAYVKSGRRTLINYESLLEYLNQPENERPRQTGGIRPIY